VPSDASTTATAVVPLIGYIAAMSNAPSDTWKEKLQDHWLTVVVILCISTAGITWTVANALLVGPRDFEIEQLKRRVGDLPSDVQIGFAVRSTTKNIGEEITILEATLKPGETAMTIDGDCVVKLVDVNGPDNVNALITLLKTGNSFDAPNWTPDSQLNTVYDFPLLPFDYTFKLLGAKDNEATIVVTRLTKPRKTIGAKDK
jgi:hypothetical protein